MHGGLATEETTRRRLDCGLLVNLSDIVVLINTTKISVDFITAE